MTAAKPIRSGPYRDNLASLIAEMAANGVNDPRIARRLDITVQQVRGIRRQYSIAPGEQRWIPESRRKTSPESSTPMIKAAGRTPDGKPIVLLGLAGENMARLMANEPIRFNLADLALPDIEVMIVGGRTASDILQALAAAGLVDKAMAEAAQNAPDGHATS